MVAGKRGGADENTKLSKRPRRSERIAGLNPIVYTWSKLAHSSAVGIQPRSASVPKSRPAREQLRDRRSAPILQPLGNCTLAKRQAEKDWSNLQVELLMSIANRLPPLAAANMRLVCLSWQKAATLGIRTLQSDVAWNLEKLASIPSKFPSVTCLDLQQSNGLVNVQPLLQMTCLKHLRLCNLFCLPQTEYIQSIGMLKQLATLELISSFTLRRLILTNFRHLKRLDLTGSTRLEEITLIGMPHLTCLSLRECRRVQSWKFLLSCPALCALDVAYCTNVNDEAMEHVAKLENLQVLVLLHCRQITDYSLRLLTQRPLLELRDVYIDGCTCTTEECILYVQQRSPSINFIKFSP